MASLSEEIACPVCEGESVAQSNAPAALNIRREIARSVDAGRTDDEIRAYLARQYGEEQLLRPRGEGLSALVWVVPVVAVVLAAGRSGARLPALGATADSPAPSDEDRELVARFLAGRRRGRAIRWREVPSRCDDGAGSGGPPAAAAGGSGPSGSPGLERP